MFSVQSTKEKYNILVPILSTASRIDFKTVNYKTGFDTPA